MEPEGIRAFPKDILPLSGYAISVNDVPILDGRDFASVMEIPDVTELQKAYMSLASQVLELEDRVRKLEDLSR